MFSEETDVQVDPSTTEQEDVTTESSPVEETESTEVSEQQPEQTAPVSTPGLLPDGRSVEQVMAENRRKSEEIAGLKTSIDEIKVAVTQKGQPQYTEEQLEAFAVDQPQHKAWAEGEKAKLRSTQIKDTIKETLDARDNKQKADSSRANALHYVQNDKRFAGCFVRDQAGQPVDWNRNDPMAQRIFQYMSNPEIGQNPNGLTVAAKLAFADLSEVQKTQVVKKTQKLEKEVKHLQKQTLVEGGGVTQQTQANPLREATQRAAKTGSMKDSAAAMKNIFKAKGVLPED